MNVRNIFIFTDDHLRSIRHRSIHILLQAGFQISKSTHSENNLSISREETVGDNGAVHLYDLIANIRIENEGISSHRGQQYSIRFAEHWCDCWESPWKCERIYCLIIGLCFFFMSHHKHPSKDLSAIILAFSFCTPSWLGTALAKAYKQVSSNLIFSLSFSSVDWGLSFICFSRMRILLSSVRDASSWGRRSSD